MPPESPSFIPEEIKLAQQADSAVNTKEETKPAFEQPINPDSYREDMNLSMWRQLLISKQRVYDAQTAGTMPEDEANTKLERIQSEIDKVSPEQHFTEEIKKLMDAGAVKGYIAQSLTGLDTPQAWQMREELSAAGVNKDSIAYSLSGLDTPQAWQMRQELLAAGAVKGYIAQSLAGLDTPQAWQMRQELLDADVNKSNIASIANSLAGLDSPQAWQMRQELLAAGVDKNTIARSLAGLDTPQAWQMRQELLLDAGVNKNHIAYSLAGLDTPQAWQMREELLLDAGVEKGDIAKGINGSYIFAIAWRAAKGLLPHQIRQQMKQEDQVKKES